MSPPPPTWREIDLHGHTWAEARDLMIKALREAYAERHAHLCFVHGRGWHSKENRAVLPTRVRDWLVELETHPRSVIARVQFGEAWRPPNPGAVFVTLLLERADPVYDPEWVEPPKRHKSRAPDPRTIEEIELPDDYLDELDEGMRRFLDDR
ncbi:MAG: Smr/MutS family protein [Planctomycetes bacterium]|nr:Smr/MutS family protein [Planctomycetota bacterium]